jgi:hypothetical protein
MIENDSTSGRKLQHDRLTRRNLIRGAAGTAAGAGLVLGSGFPLPAFAGDDDEGEHNKCKVLARPIPHITTPPGQHFFFPGPPDGSAPSTFPHFPNAGFDPSTVTDFKGVIAQADLNFSGTGTDLNTGDSTDYMFHTDWRFFKGTFVGVDGLAREGALSFI